MPELPLGWREKPLGDIAEVRVSNVDKKSRPVEISVRLCNYLDAYREDYLDESHPYMVATATPSEVTKFGLRAGDVLVTKDSETPYDIGVAAVIEAAPENLVCGYHLAMVRPTAQLNPVWLAKQFGTTRVQGYLAARATGSTRYGLSNATLVNLPIFIPLREEQDRIIAVLRTLDEAIVRTEHLIAKLNQMKQGLVRDLLTRGIDESGALRDPERHPELFKHSAVGRVPTAWHVVRLVDVVVLPSGQLDPKLEPYQSWPLIAPDHIEAGTGRLLAKETAASQGAISGKYGFQAGDVLYSKIRPYLRKATLADCEGLCSADMYPLRPGAQVRSRFLLAVILGEDFSRFAESVSMRSGFPKINREELGEYSLGLPDLAEQHRLGQVLSTFDDRIAHEESLLSKLRILKQGLTEDLLTGRVRVTKLLEGSAA